MSEACPICGSTSGDQPWVLLNRYGYGTGKCRGMTEMLNEDSEYHWDVGEDLDAEDEIVSGVTLCFPRCLQTYLEGKMIEADIRMGHTE